MTLYLLFPLPGVPSSTHVFLSQGNYSSPLKSLAQVVPPLCCPRGTQCISNAISGSPVYVCDKISEESHSPDSQGRLPGEELLSWTLNDK